MTRKQNLERHGSSGNVFEDLGFPDAGEHLVKASLVLKIERTIQERQLSHTEAARAMGVDQAAVAAMLAGQFRGYAVERLTRFLVALGHPSPEIL